MCDEELIAMALSMRALASTDDSLEENYLLIRVVCYEQTNVDVAILGHHMDRLDRCVRTD